MTDHLSTFYKNTTARAIGAVFAVIGILFGTWAAFIPYVKAKLGLDEAQLGVLLLMLPLGAALMNPLCVPLIRKLGSVKATVLSILFVGVALIPPVHLGNVYLLGVFLVVYGMSYSAANITMNTCATQLEAHTNINIISTCHGLWSGGAMIGAALAGLSQEWNIDPKHYVLGMLGFVTLVALLVKRPLSNVPDEQIGEVNVSTGKAFLRPNGALLTLIFIGLCVNLAEGTMADWAAVYVKEVMDAPVSLAGIGFSVYAFFMMSGRLMGDSLVSRFGAKQMLLYCGCSTTAGYLICVFAPNIPILFCGLALIGLGVSLGSPVLYAASSKVPGLPKGAGLAIYTTYAMVGFLGGPVLVGFLAKAFSLPVAFAIVALFALIGVLLTRRMKRV